MAKVGKKGTLFGKPREEVIKHPGALTKTAKAAGESVSEFINEKHSGASARTKKRIALAKAFRTMRSKRAAK
jgi:hypothetical protein